MPATTEAANLVLPYARDGVASPVVTELEDGGVEILVPPQGWRIFVPQTLIDMIIVILAVLGVMAYLALMIYATIAWKSLVSAYGITIGCGFVALLIPLRLYVGRERTRIRADRTGLRIWVTGGRPRMDERFFPRDRIYDIDVTWACSKLAGFGGLRVHAHPHPRVVVASPVEEFLRGYDPRHLRTIVLYLRRALELGDREIRVPRNL
jgi:hypothetical protein